VDIPLYAGGSTLRCNGTATALGAEGGVFGGKRGDILSRVASMMSSFMSLIAST